MKTVRNDPISVSMGNDYGISGLMMMCGGGDVTICVSSCLFVQKSWMCG